MSRESSALLQLQGHSSATYHQQQDQQQQVQGALDYLAPQAQMLNSTTTGGSGGATLPRLQDLNALQRDLSTQSYWSSQGSNSEFQELASNIDMIRHSVHSTTSSTGPGTSGPAPSLCRHPAGVQLQVQHHQGHQDHLQTSQSQHQMTFLQQNLRLLIDFMKTSNNGQPGGPPEGATTSSPPTRTTTTTQAQAVLDGPQVAQGSSTPSCRIRGVTRSTTTTGVVMSPPGEERGEGVEHQESSLYRNDEISSDPGAIHAVVAQGQLYSPRSC
ncbi:unnamed protein product [Amoebophrya sp. A25]|nr:unnamed protein product [Amoebophrya sp. A25]|eukprot:GSA25T00014745001.1